MKKLILLALAAFTLNAHAQLNKEWTTVNSISGGIYETESAQYLRGTLDFVVSASNDYFEPSEDSIKGVIRGIDSSGAVLFTTVLSPAVSLATFPEGGIPRHGITGQGSGTANPVVIYNTDPSTSHLIKINSNGTIAWDHVLSGVNNVPSITVNNDPGTVNNPVIYIIGQTPQTTCGAFQCNGIAVAKYDSSGQQIWKKTKYTTGYRTLPIDITLDINGRVIVCGKKAANALQPQTAYDKSFVTVYDNNGTAVWTKEFSSFTDGGWLADYLYDKSQVSSDVNGDIWFADTQYDSQTNVPTVKLRKLNGTTGATIFTKTINNAEVLGITVNPQPNIIMTSTGMKAYNSAGTLLWSNSHIVSQFGENLDYTEFTEIVAKNVSAAEPLSNFLVQLDAATGAVLFQKNLSFGNHEEYTGEYAGVIALDTWEHAYLLINDTVSPYGTRLTKLSPCSEFTYNFNVTAVAVNVNNTTCNNGQINVSWTGTFNSWPYLELWKGTSLVDITDFTLLTTSHSFQNLTPGTYTIKAFDESCGQKNISITVKCPAPSAGLATTNITSTSAKAKWNAPACNNTFRIQYRQTGTTAWTTVSGIAATNYTMTGLTPGLGYQWKVATKCTSTGTAVYSAYSVIKTFTTQSPRLAGTYTVPAINEMSIQINPNPVNDKMMITSEDGISAAVIKIFNAQGQLVLEKNIKALNENVAVEIETGSLTNGVYLMHVNSEEGRVAKRFLKE